MQMLEASVGELQNYEEACAPPGWQCLWDRLVLNECFVSEFFECFTPVSVPVYF